MPRTRAAKSEARRPPSSAALERQARRFLELKRGFEHLEYFCKGTVLKRMMKCGKANCACASDPAKRHGPYFELTYKVNGKTVNLKLSPEAAPLYGCLHAVSKAENPAQPPRKALAKHPSPSGQTGTILEP